MSCCGKSSSTARGSNGHRAPAFSAAGNAAPLIAYFRCTGPSGITAVGAVSGKPYRFPASGLLVPVEARDAASLSRVPHLQAVRPR
jgi:hypothetical protein